MKGTIRRIQEDSSRKTIISRGGPVYKNFRFELQDCLDNNLINRQYKGRGDIYWNKDEKRDSQYTFQWHKVGANFWIKFLELLVNQNF